MNVGGIPIGWLPGDILTLVAGVSYRETQVEVTDGQLTLFLDDLGGSDPWVLINGLSVSSVETAAAATGFAATGAGYADTARLSSTALATRSLHGPAEERIGADSVVRPDQQALEAKEHLARGPRRVLQTSSAGDAAFRLPDDPGGQPSEAALDAVVSDGNSPANTPRDNLDLMRILNGPDAERTTRTSSALSSIAPSSPPRIRTCSGSRSNNRMRTQSAGV